MQPQDPELACLEHFFRVAMPAAVRKLSAWQGLSKVYHGDLVDDLAQEVAADFVAHRQSIEAMSIDQRHERWLRLVGRSHYWLRGRTASARQSEAALDEIAAAVSAATQDPALGSGDAKFAETLMQHGVHLKNGRLNELITARSIGLTPLQLRRRGERLVAALQGGRDIEFWRRRLTEALLGLAADVLRDGRHVLILEEHGRNRPDPHARLRRVLRIRERLRYLPVDATLRRVLLRYGSKCRNPHDPERALKSALDLSPNAPHVHLWCFELAIARRHPQRAAHALRQARACAADATAVVLARARLLEVRGCDHAARALLRRAQRRSDDRRLRVCLDRMTQPIKASG